MPVLHRRPGDLTLFATVLALLAIGLVMVYSASSVVAYDRLEDSAYFFKRQAMWVALGLVAMAIARGIYYQRLRAYTVPVLIASGALLVLVLIPSIGQIAGGARRWLVAGPVRFQPVELAKLALVLYLAHFVARRGPGIRNLRRGLIPPLAIAGAFAALVLRQPDMGSALVLGGVAIAALFLGGARVIHLAMVVLAALPIVAAAVLAAEYRFQRFVAFLDPWRDPQGSGFH
ncbi:MAG: FtsW/RodA/SpoVE family cell cycle protein, partial [Armatimonadetes bacterium]|nr:FtsW/RodA/SpoVE family cell cycle protein [Armatimonadota bacterium]